MAEANYAKETIINTPLDTGNNSVIVNVIGVTNSRIITKLN